MITTANYIIKATIKDRIFIMQFNGGDVWSALEEFWHEDWPDVMEQFGGGDTFPLDVYAMDGTEVITTYAFTFNAAVFHAFYDKGHKAKGVYTLDEFERDIRRNVNDNGNNSQLSTVNSQLKSNDVTSFFYMWNRWCEEECKKAFAGGDYNHLWNKWCEAYDTMKGPRGAAELFYMMLSKSNRDLLVKRACEVYDGNRERY